MSNYDDKSLEDPPSPAWEPIQNLLHAPNPSIKISKPESFQTVVETQRFVNRYFAVNDQNAFETSQQVSSITQPTFQMTPNNTYLKSSYLNQPGKNLERQEMNRSISQLTFVKSGPSKTFISSNTMIGSAITPGSESQTKSSSSQSTYRIVDSTAAYISSQIQLSQKMKVLSEQSAMVPYNPPKTLSQPNVRNRVMGGSSTYGGQSDYTSSLQDNSIESIDIPVMYQWKKKRQMTSPTSLASNCTQTVSTDGKIKSNDLVHWPVESYGERALSNKEFIVHNDSQRYENNGSATPEQVTSVTQSSIMLHAREMSSPPQAINYETVISDEQHATNNGNSKSNDIATSKHSPREVTTLVEGSGRKHSPSSAREGSYIVSKELIQSPKIFEVKSPSVDLISEGTTFGQDHQLQSQFNYARNFPNNEYFLPNELLQQKTTLMALDTPKTSSEPMPSYPVKAEMGMLKGQSQMKVPETALAGHSYTQGSGAKSVFSQQSHYNRTVPKTPIKEHTLADSNNDGIKSNEIVKFNTASRVESSYGPALLKNDLPQATNKKTLKSDDAPRPPTTLEEKSIIKYSPSHAGSCNPSIETNAIVQSSTTSDGNGTQKIQLSQSVDAPAEIDNTFSALVPEERTSGHENQLQLQPLMKFTDKETSPSKEYFISSDQQTSTSEFNAPTTSQPIYSYPLTVQSYNLDELSNNPMIFAVDDNTMLYQDDTFLQYPGVEYEVTIPADQPHYQIPNTAIESTTLGTEPVKTYTLVPNDNKVIIESNVLIEPPNASLVKSTYAQALPKNPRKNSKQVIRQPATSKAGPMVSSNQFKFQSKLPLKTVAGANSTRTTQSNVDMKSNGSIKQPAMKSQLKPLPRQVTAPQTTQHSDFDRLKQQSRIMKPVQQVHRPHQGPHPLPQQTKKLDSKSAPLKRKQKENISPVSTFKKPLLQEPDKVKTTSHDKSFTLPDISIERIVIVGGIEKKVPLNGMKFQTSSERNSNPMTLTDCMQKLLRNNVQVFKVPMPMDNALAKYLKQLENNNVSVTKLKKK